MGKKKNEEMKVKAIMKYLFFFFFWNDGITIYTRTSPPLLVMRWTSIAPLWLLLLSHLVYPRPRAHTHKKSILKSPSSLSLIPSKKTEGVREVGSKLKRRSLMKADEKNPRGPRGGGK